VANKNFLVCFDLDSSFVRSQEPLDGSGCHGHCAIQTADCHPVFEGNCFHCLAEFVTVVLHLAFSSAAVAGPKQNVGIALDDA
jgi:hypothetical protein